MVPKLDWIVHVGLPVLSDGEPVRGHVMICLTRPQNATWKVTDIYAIGEKLGLQCECAPQRVFPTLRAEASVQETASVELNARFTSPALHGATGLWIPGHAHEVEP